MPDGVSEDALFENLSTLDSNYSDGADYDIRATQGGDTRGTDGYNSNSYVSGILGAAGVTPPEAGVGNSPGYDKPLPPENFRDENN